MSGTDDNICIERRRHERRELKRPCKILHSPTFRYMAAHTCDVSPGGAMLELSQHRPLAIGDQVDVLVDWHGHGIVSQRAMLGARVVRLGERDGLRQRVGIRFDREQAITLAA
jgi:hypothetical protein